MRPGAVAQASMRELVRRCGAEVATLHSGSGAPRLKPVQGCRS